MDTVRRVIGIEDARSHLKEGVAGRCLGEEDEDDEEVLREVS